MQREHALALAGLREGCGVKLTWKTARHPDVLESAKACEASLCGNYRLHLSGRTGLWVCVYLPDPQRSTSIAVLRSRDAVAEWAAGHAGERVMEKAA